MNNIVIPEKLSSKIVMLGYLLKDNISRENSL